MHKMNLAFKATVLVCAIRDSVRISFCSWTVRVLLGRGCGSLSSFKDVRVCVPGGSRAGWGLSGVALHSVLALISCASHSRLHLRIIAIVLSGWTESEGSFF